VQTRSAAQIEAVGHFRNAVTAIGNESCVGCIVRDAIQLVSSSRVWLQLLSFVAAAAMAREFRKTSVKPTTTFRGVLEIGAELGIGMYAYLRETKAPLLRPTKLSGRVELVIFIYLLGVFFFIPQTHQCSFSPTRRTSLTLGR
jgi:hypothetical protein